MPALARAGHSAASSLLILVAVTALTVTTAGYHVTRLLLGLATVAGLFILGPRRLIKQATLVLLLLFAAEVVQEQGVLGLVVMVPAVAVPLLLMMLGLLAYRKQVRRSLEPVAESGFPPYSIPLVEQHTAELSALGFIPAGDWMTRWRTLFSERKTFIRLFRHPIEPMWAEIHALQRPRVVGRAVISRTEAGAIETFDRQPDQSMFVTPDFHWQQVGEDATAADLVEVHRARLGELGVTLLPVADPREASRATYDAWVQSLAGSGQIRVRGTWYGLSVRAVPRAIARIFGGWIL